MSCDVSTSDVANPGPPVGPWIRALPEGSVSVAAEGNSLVLRASKGLQQQYESLLPRHKAGTLTADQEREVKAVRILDQALSWLNRLARGPNVARLSHAGRPCTPEQ